VSLDRIRGSLEMLVQDSDTGREVTEDGMFATLFLPVIFAFVLMLSAFTTSGFLMQGLVEERTSRIIEILVTSITPMQLLLGKIIGLGLLGLTQVLALLIAAVAILQIGSGSLEFLQGISIPLDLAVMAIIYYLLGYFLMAAILATVGVLTNSEQESRQISSFIMMPFILPYILIFFFITDPNGTVPTILSLVPVTAPMAILMRFGLTEVPTWQIILSMVLMLITIVVVVWLSARVFRWGLLLYGKKFNLREVWRVITSRQVSMGTTAAHSTQEGAI
jgi:ABC-2 type transport system permease protein